MDVSRASLDDVEQIRALIDIYARRGIMLSRSLSYLYDNIRDYYVVRDGRNVIGCCALHVVWRDLAEVKSLAVHPDWQGKGIGRTLLLAAIDEAAQMGLERVFTLTSEPGFFLKHGFLNVEKDSLPMKIWGECIQCPKYPECDEVALEILVARRA